MTEKAKEARRAYKRKWAKEHPDKVKQYQETYWEKRAAAEKDGKNVLGEENCGEKDGGSE